MRSAHLHGGLAAQALLEIAHQPQRQMLLVHPIPQRRRLRARNAISLQRPRHPRREQWLGLGAADAEMQCKLTMPCSYRGRSGRSPHRSPQRHNMSAERELAHHMPTCAHARWPYGAPGVLGVAAAAICAAAMCAAAAETDMPGAATWCGRPSCCVRFCMKAECAAFG